MAFEESFTTAETLEVFDDEVRKLDGTVRGVAHGAGLLYARAILPEQMPLTPRDMFCQGVAIRASSEKADICPYLFRIVCRNGLTLYRALNGLRVVGFSEMTKDEVDSTLRLTIQMAAAPQGFQDAIEGLKELSQVPAGRQAERLFRALMSSANINLLESLRRISQQFRVGDDRSLFGLVNAVTAVARDESDPSRQWELEVLAGRIVADAVDPTLHATGHGLAMSRGLERATFDDPSCVQSLPEEVR